MNNRMSNAKGRLRLHSNGASDREIYFEIIIIIQRRMKFDLGEDMDRDAMGAQTHWTLYICSMMMRMIVHIYIDSEQ